ncbi:cyclophilin-like fold protein [Psychrobacillus sp. NPDC093180]|uniref:cyclophilin-like fold protein n=1 Tax=Psychrobacillus sp. NPDC093180 TaxID=3364489 RepID=UPI0038111ECC
MKILNDEYPVTLNDSQAAKDFGDLFPLTLTLEDYSNTEKVADLPHPLEVSDSPSGTAADKGDVSYYAPWGNLAIFYKDFRYSEGLVNLGKIDQGSEMLTKYGESFEVTFLKYE